MKKNKKLKFISLIFLSLFVLFCQTIVYSAINATMSIRGDAYARAEADVRITDFRLASATNATSSFEEFGKTHIITELDLTDATSSITYYVEITNYGSVDVGIFDITGLPSGVNYSIKDYNLHDKICDDSGKCNSFIKKTYELTLTTTSTYAGNIQMNFDFRTFHQVRYTNITNNNYPTEVIDGGDLNVTFTESLKRVQVLSNNTELGYYKTISSGQTISLNNITNDVEVKKKPQVAKLVSGDLNESGSEVCIGDECFYIMSNDGEIVTMLAKYNLYAGGDYSGGNYNYYGTSAINIQDSEMIGYITGEETYKGVIQFSGTNYWENVENSYPTYVYNENSYLYNPIEQYKAYLKKLGVSLIDARLISYEELESLGCSGSDKTCDSAPNWLYSTSYWTGSANDSEYLWYVRTNKMFDIRVYNFSCYFGIRPVLEIPVDEIKPLIRIESGDLDTVGSELCIKDECFYVISSDENNVTMLAKYNLYVGNECTAASASTCTKYGDAATGIQDASMIGYKLGQTIRKGTINFSNTNYWSNTISTYPSNVYNENTTAYSYIENYKNYLTTIGATPTAARIITYDELINLGCNGLDENCRSAPEWVYATSYWTDTAATSTNLWALNTYGNFYHLDYQYTGTFGCRPVIEIPKWTFSNKIKFTISGGTYYAKEGMSWGEWINSIYNPTEALVQPGLCSNGREYYSSGSFIKNSFSDSVALNNNNVLSTDAIIAGAEYDIN